MTLDGPMNAATFCAYTEQVLAPTLRPGDIVVMDNLPAHTAVRTLIEASGANLLRLPPYSPDFNPIETLLRNSNPTSAKPLPELSRRSKAQSTMLSSIYTRRMRQLL
jgi:transposase